MLPTQRNTEAVPYVIFFKIDTERSHARMLRLFEIIHYGYWTDNKKLRN